MILQFKDDKGQRTLISKEDDGSLLIECIQSEKLVATLMFGADQATELKQFLDMKGF